METLRQWLFVLACIPTIGGPIITAILAPKPVEVSEHAKGVGRLLMIGGAGFGAIAVIFYGAVPEWNCLALTVGVAVHITLRAREQHLTALRDEGITNLWQYLHERMPVIWHAILAKFSRKESHHA